MTMSSMPVTMLAAAGVRNRGETLLRNTGRVRRLAMP